MRGLQYAPPPAPAECRDQPARHAFVVIGALKLTDSNAKSYADECAWCAAVFFLAAITCSYWAIRRNNSNQALNIVADTSFFVGLLLLTMSLLIGAIVL